MKYFKAAFLAAIGWRAGELAFDVAVRVASETCKKVDGRMSNKPREGETLRDYAERRQREETGIFTVRGFCSE